MSLGGGLYDDRHRLGVVIQHAYVVEDLQRSIAACAERLGVGPWYVRGPFACPPRLPPAPFSAPMITVARAFSGKVMIEYIALHDDAPSVYRDTLGPRGYGFHHWGVGVRDFDGERRRYAGSGARAVMEFTAPTGARVVYFDTAGELPGMVEIIEMTPEHEAGYEAIYLAALEWDGSELIRPEAPG